MWKPVITWTKALGIFHIRPCNASQIQHRAGNRWRISSTVILQPRDTSRRQYLSGITNFAETSLRWHWGKIWAISPIPLRWTTSRCNRRNTGARGTIWWCPIKNYQHCPAWYGTSSARGAKATGEPLKLTEEKKTKPPPACAKVSTEAEKAKPPPKHLQGSTDTTVKIEPKPHPPDYPPPKRSSDTPEEASNSAGKKVKVEVPKPPAAPERTTKQTLSNKIPAPPIRRIWSNRPKNSSSLTRV